jgi:hypothetical protein
LRVACKLHLKGLVIEPDAAKYWLSTSTLLLTETFQKAQCPLSLYITITQPAANQSLITHTPYPPAVRKLAACMCSGVNSAHLPLEALEQKKKKRKRLRIHSDAVSSQKVTFDADGAPCSHFEAFGSVSKVFPSHHMFSCCAVLKMQCTSKVARCALHVPRMLGHLIDRKEHEALRCASLHFMGLFTSRFCVGV